MSIVALWKPDPFEGRTLFFSSEDLRTSVGIDRAPSVDYLENRLQLHKECSIEEGRAALRQGSVVLFRPNETEICWIMADE